jgi:hypothetical protein
VNEPAAKLAEHTVTRCLWNGLPLLSTPVIDPFG